MSPPMIPGVVLLEGDFVVGVWDVTWKCGTCPFVHSRNLILVRRAGSHVLFQFAFEKEAEIYAFAKKPPSDDEAFAQVDAMVDSNVEAGGSGKKRCARIDSDDIVSLGKRLNGFLGLSANQGLLSLSDGKLSL